MTTECLVECREALAQPSDLHRLMLLLRIEPTGPAPARVEVVLGLGADFGR